LKTGFIVYGKRIFSRMDIAMSILKITPTILASKKLIGIVHPL